MSLVSFVNHHIPAKNASITAVGVARMPVVQRVVHQAAVRVLVTEQVPDLVLQHGEQVHLPRAARQGVDRVMSPYGRRSFPARRPSAGPVRGLLGGKDLTGHAKYLRSLPVWNTSEKGREVESLFRVQEGVFFWIGGKTQSPSANSSSKSKSSTFSP